MMTKKRARVLGGLSLLVLLLSTTVLATADPKTKLQQSHYLQLTIPLIAELSLVAGEPVELVYNPEEGFFRSDEIRVTYRCNAKNWALVLTANNFRHLMEQETDRAEIPVAGYLSAVAGDKVYHYEEDGITIAGNHNTGTAEETANISYRLELPPDVDYYAGDEYQTKVTYTLFVFD